MAVAPSAFSEEQRAGEVVGEAKGRSRRESTLQSISLARLRSSDHNLLSPGLGAAPYTHTQSTEGDAES